MAGELALSIGLPMAFGLGFPIALICCIARCQKAAAKKMIQLSMISNPGLKGPYIHMRGPNGEIPIISNNYINQMQPMHTSAPYAMDMSA